MSALRSYGRERFPAAVFVPAILALATLAWSATAGTLASLPWYVAAVSLLVVQFRLWDDLEDVDRDRRLHPTRVLCRTPLVVFRVLHASLMVAAGVMLGVQGIPAYAALCLTALVAYRLLRARVCDRLWRYGCLLLKYPAFVAVVAIAAHSPHSPYSPYSPESLWRLASAAAAAYALAAVYEALHTARAATTTRALGVEA
jgi:hypothetical protein